DEGVRILDARYGQCHGVCTMGAILHEVSPTIGGCCDPVGIQVIQPSITIIAAHGYLPVAVVKCYACVVVWLSRQGASAVQYIPGGANIITENQAFGRLHIKIAIGMNATIDFHSDSGSDFKNGIIKYVEKEQWDILYFEDL